DGEPQRDADQDREPQAGPRADAVVEEDRTRDVGADADVEGMAERKLPGESHHHVPGLAGIGEVQDQRRHRERVVAGDEWQRDERRSENAEINRRRTPAAFHVRRPRRPWGRSNRTSIKRPKLNMLFAEGAMKSPASASDTP